MKSGKISVNLEDVKLTLVIPSKKKNLNGKENATGRTRKPRQEQEN